MQETFDPYHKWLGIPPGEQPATHYRLLGIAPFESDPDVIEAAADQRMAHVRTYQAGKNSAASQKILNELSGAKLCLLDPRKKAAYDAALRRDLAAAPKRSDIEASSGESVADNELLEQLSRAVATSESTSPLPRRAAAPRRKAPVWQAVAGAAAAFTLAMTAFFWLRASDSRKETAQAARLGVEGRPTSASFRSPHAPESSQKPSKRGRPDEVRHTASSTGTEQVAGHAESSGESANNTAVVPTLVAEAPASPDVGLSDSNATPDQPAPAPKPSPEPAPQHAVALADEEGEGASARSSRPRDDSRAEMPDADALAKADALIRETYKNELAADDKAGAARSLIAAVNQTTVPDEKAALLLTAADAAAAAGAYKLAFKAYDDLAQRFEFDGLEAKVKTLEGAAKLARTGDECASVAKAALELLDEAAQAGRFDSADRLGKAAQAAALHTKNLKLRKEIAATRADLKKRRSEYEASQRAIADANRVLVEHPDDPAANEVIGKHLCFEENDWDLGLEKLAKAPAGALRDAAVADSKGAASAEEQVKIGDLWWDLSEAGHQRASPKACRRRAVFWYAQGLAGVTGLLKTRTEKRLEDAGKVNLSSQTIIGKHKATIMLAPGVPLVLVKIPASADGRVKSFWLGQTEVTQKQWRAVMGKVECAAMGDDLPVQNQDGVQCLELCKRMGQIVARFVFRAPTEEQWSHAFGSPAQYGPNFADTTWCEVNAGGTPHAVAKLKPNAFGLYDMLGNVRERVGDCGVALGIDYISGPGTGQFDRQAVQVKSYLNNTGFRVAAESR